MRAVLFFFSKKNNFNGFFVVVVVEGKINLQKGTTHFLKRSDVEALVRQGIVEHIM
jgi:hypothetical protein